jgi:hypothetical protein
VLQEVQGERGTAVANGPWAGRDGFVAETAVQFDRVNATIARLEREVERSRQTLAEMSEEAGRARRFQAFEENLRNSRDYKITDMQRGFRDLKTRLDAIEGERSTFVGLTYKSFCDVDRKLSELADLQMMVERAQANARRFALLFGISAAVAVSIILAQVV